MSSELLHLTGLAIGAPVAIIFLKRNWVDCEGWDLLSLNSKDADELKKRGGSRRIERDRIAHQERLEAKEKHLKQVTTALSNALSKQQPMAATAIYAKHENEFQQGELLDDRQLQQLIQAHHVSKQWVAPMPLLVQLLQRFPPDRTANARLKLAQILIQADQRPQQALAVLKKLPPSLTEKQQRLKSQLVALANKAIQAGSYEVDLKDW